MSDVKTHQDGHDVTVRTTKDSSGGGTTRETFVDHRSVDIAHSDKDGNTHSHEVERHWWGTEPGKRK